jgi:DNA-directed RNA polymerase specialized sigma subunit
MIKEETDYPIKKMGEGLKKNFTNKEEGFNRVEDAITIYLKGLAKEVESSNNPYFNRFHNYLKSVIGNKVLQTIRSTELSVKSDSLEDKLEAEGEIKEFLEKILDLAKEYNVDPELAEQYVFSMKIVELLGLERDKIPSFLKEIYHELEEKKDPDCSNYFKIKQIAIGEEIKALKKQRNYEPISYNTIDNYLKQGDRVQP